MITYMKSPGWESIHRDVEQLGGYQELEGEENGGASA